MNAIKFIEEKRRMCSVYGHCGVCPAFRHGRWLTWEEQFPESTPKKKNNLGVFCDKCHNHADNQTDYCPNCGAKMDEVNNGKEKQ